MEEDSFSDGWSPASFAFPVLAYEARLRGGGREDDPNARVGSKKALVSSLRPWRAG